MGTSLVTARPTTSLRPSWRSIDCSPDVLSSLNTGPKLIACFGQRERPQHGLRLEHEGRANRDRRVHARRAPADVTYRPRIRAASLRFELVDDFHGAHLGCAADRPGGETRAKHVERVVPVLQLSAHLAHEVLHVRVALDLQ